MTKLQTRQRALFSWLLLGLLAALCVTLAVLQYRWIGAISNAEQDRLEDSLHLSLLRVAGEFNRELAAASGRLTPNADQVDRLGVEPAYAARYNEWRMSAAHPLLFRKLALAIPAGEQLKLRKFDSSRGTFSDSEWPAEWMPLQEWMRSRLDGHGGPGFGPPRGGRPPVEDTLLLDLPRFGGGGPGPGTEQNWLIAEVDATYVAERWIPQLVDRHLGLSLLSQFEVQVAFRENPAHLIYRSSEAGTGQAGPVEARMTDRAPDAAVTFFDTRPEPMGGPRRPEPMGGPRPPESMRPQPADSGRGRLVLSLRHNAGSLDAAVALHRWRNLGVSVGIILLMAVSGAMLFRLSRQAQQLADLQMQFVAGVSHELRTPLTVIRTAAYNLRGRIAGNAAQVERYGALIQDESEKLTAIVEQVLRFAGAKAGKVIRDREPVQVYDVIDDAILACRASFENSKLTLEKNVAPDLPMVMADPMALKHAVQNLIQNAVKYGTEGNNWIGVSASATNETTLEIRIADRGPGIPEDEQPRVFDPFFRGKRAVQDQIHGTGLGLNLVKQIVEAHGGSIRVESEIMKGTAFVIRLPIAPAEHQDEFANTVSRG